MSDITTLGLPLIVLDVVQHSVLRSEAFQIVTCSRVNRTANQFDSSVGYMLLIQFKHQANLKVCLFPEWLLEKSNIDTTVSPDQFFKFHMNEDGKKDGTALIIIPA